MTDVLRQHVLPRLQRVKPVGQGQYKASCPVPGHGKGNGDRNPSLSVGPGRTQPVVFKCQALCDQEDVKNALINLGVDWELVSEGRSRTFDDSPDRRRDEYIPCAKDPDTGKPLPGHRRVRDYEYRRPDGTVEFGVGRCALKGNGCEGFRTWHPDPAKAWGRTWRLTRADGTRVDTTLPYRLPEALQAIREETTLFIVGGEKDADRLASLGYPATTNYGGESNWTAAHAQWLAGADVVVVADRDETGRRWATRVVETLMPLARSIEVVQAAEGKDASDHLDAGKRIGQFVQVAEPIPYPSVVCPGCPDCENEGGQ